MTTRILFQLTCVITLTSCLEKHFTSVIINSRLTFLSNEIISKDQSGFRKGSSTADNIFVMHALVSIYYVIVHLLISLRHSTLCGELASGKKCLRLVNAIKLSIICMIILNLAICIMISNHTFFSCMTGVRQLENLSPFYFLCF